MPKAPKMSDALPGDLENDVEHAAAAAIEQAVPPELKEHAKTFFQSVLQGAQRSPIAALLVAAAIGFVISLLIGK